MEEEELRNTNMGCLMFSFLLTADQLKCYMMCEVQVEPVPPVVQIFKEMLVFLK